MALEILGQSFDVIKKDSINSCYFLKKGIPKATGLPVASGETDGKPCILFINLSTSKSYRCVYT